MPFSTLGIPDFNRLSGDEYYKEICKTGISVLQIIFYKDRQTIKPLCNLRPQRRPRRILLGPVPLPELDLPARPPQRLPVHTS